MKWDKEEIIRWMHTNDVYGKKSPSQQKMFEDSFIEEAEKHQETAGDRKLYRGALKIVRSSSARKTATIQSFLQI